MSAVSKHQRWTPDGDWIPGKLIVRPNSSLRKLMRASSRGMIPPERMGIIESAQQRASKRRALYLNSRRARTAARTTA